MAIFTEDHLVSLIVAWVNTSPFVNSFFYSTVFASRVGGRRSHHLDHEILHGHHVPPLFPDLVAAGQNPRRRTRNRLRPRETQRITKGAAQQLMNGRECMLALG